MKKKLLVLIIAVFAAVAVLSGCTETFRQNAISGDYDNLTIESNGGLAVRAGKYVFYLNGYAGQDGENVFGEALKGAVMRATIKDNGDIDPDSAVVIVPKNVYNTVKTSGLFIVDGWLYYTCPSTKKDSSGKYQTANMVLLRTKLDGTDTEEIKTFSAYTPTFKVGKTAVMYYDSSTYELHSINLEDKKDTTVAETVRGFVFSDNDPANGFNEWAFYVKNPEDAVGATHNEVYKVKLDGTGSEKLIDGKSSYSDALKNEQIKGSAAEKGFNITLKNVYLKADGIRLIYSKTDSGQNTVSQGLYMLETGDGIAFDETRETKLSSNGKVSEQDDSYTSFYFIDDDNILATGSSSVQWIIRNDATKSWSPKFRTETDTGNGVEKSGHCISVAATVVKYEVSGDTGTLYFFNGTKLQKYDVIKYVNGKPSAYADANAVDVIDSVSATTSWLPAELIGDNLIYWDSNVSNYTYVIDVGNIKMSDKLNKCDQDTVVKTLVSKVTEEDKAALLS